MTIQDKIDLTLWLAFANLFLMVTLAIWFVWREIRHDEWEDSYEEGRADYSASDHYSRLDKLDGLED